MTRQLIRLRTELIVGFHVAVVAASMPAAFVLRFDFEVPPNEWRLAAAGTAIALLVKLPVFGRAGLFGGSFRFAGIRDLSRILAANAAASALLTGVVLLWLAPSGFPRSACVIDFLLCFVATAGGRFAVRAYREARAATMAGRGKVALIYGAGAAGRLLLREIQSNPSLGYHVAGFVDDDRNLRGMTIMNIPVLGTGRQVASIVDRYGTRATPIEEIIVAMPSASARQQREAIANCRSAGVACKTLPRFGELLTGQVLSSQIRHINLVDLLGREPVRLEEDRIHESLTGRRVLVTGAAGSIGSELCRQTARFGPATLILFDQAESPLYQVDLELRAQYPLLEIVTELGDVRDAATVEAVIRRHRVEAIFHAAAYKHVPMIERHVLEGVRTNVLGTWNLVRAAYRNHVSNFLMISTDKAVNPTSIMGLTKRVAELIVHARASNGSESPTRFASVRFGNVLGSNGSVVPLFQAQIASGGPVTVTHPEMRRYFMSIPEAVQLVLQASTMCKDSEIFVLDMGEPVRIMDLAVNMIGLAGLVPHEDVEIRICGMRPGEKLFEELAIEGEDISPTFHEKIKIFSGTRLSRRQLESWIELLVSLLQTRDADAVLDHLRTLVPEYQPQAAVAAAGGQAVAGAGAAAAALTDWRHLPGLGREWRRPEGAHAPAPQPSST